MKKVLVGGVLAVGVLILTMERLSRSQPAESLSPGAALPTVGVQDEIQTRPLPTGERVEVETEEEAPEEDRSAQLRNQMMSLVVNTEFVELLEDLKSDEDSTDADLHRVAVRRWADLDGAAAADWVGQLEPGLARAEGLRQVAIGWANADLTSATEWARSFPEEPERNAVLLNVAYEAARSLPTEALALAELLPAGTERDDLLVHAASQWAAVEPDRKSVV